MQMGVTIVPDDTAEAKAKKTSRNKKNPKRRYTTADLPFPRGQSSKYQNKWRNQVLGAFIDYAGTLTDVFGAMNDDQVEEALRLIWSDVFPELADKESDPAILAVVRLLCLLSLVFVTD